MLIAILLVALTGQLVDGSYYNINQERPSFKFQQNNFISSGQVLIGNNSDSKFEMLSTRFTTTNSMVTILGDPTIEVLNPFQLNISGTLIKDVNVNSRIIGTYFEVNDYLEEFNELERYRITDNQQYVETDNSFEFERNISRFPYNFFQTNDNYTMIEDQRSGITAFIQRLGSINNIKLNDTEATGQIFAFRISITIVYYDTLTKQFRGAHLTNDFGYGNIIPESIISYLRSNEFTRTLVRGSIGEKLFENYSFSNIEWIDSGHNSTLGLDIYSGLYFYSRESSSLIFDSAENLQSLELDQIGDDFEEFQDDLINNNIIDAFNDELLNIFENDLSEGVLQEGGVTISTTITEPQTDRTIPNVTNLYDENIFFISQITALFIVTIVLLRRKTNS